MYSIFNAPSDRDCQPQAEPDAPERCYDCLANLDAGEAHEEWCEAERWDGEAE